MMFMPRVGLVFLLLFVAVHASSFSHPGVLVSKTQLDFIKAQVNAKADPIYTAYTKATKSDLGSLTYKAQGPPSDGVIDCGSYSNPNYGCSADDSDGSAAYVQSLLWYITGNKQYATNAITLLNRYGSNLKKFNNTNAPLQTAWSGLKWTRAAEIIRYSDAGWSQNDINAFANLLTKVYLPTIYDGSGSNGNWELSMIEAMFGIAVFTEDVSLFNHTTTFWRQRVPAYFYYEPIDGNKPQKAPRGNPSWYGQDTFNSSVNGIAQETCRDLGHTQYGIASTINSAETAYIQGVNLYSEEGPRLRAALEFNSNFLIGAQVPKYVCGGEVDVVQYPTFEVSYNEYHNRAGYNLPHELDQLTTHVRTMSNPSENHIMVYETLTHGASP